MSSVNQNDVKNLLGFVLQTENESYRENPVPTRAENRIKIREYRKKVEEITVNIAEREGLKYEN